MEISQNTWLIFFPLFFFRSHIMLALPSSSFSSFYRLIFPLSSLGCFQNGNFSSQIYRMFQLSFQKRQNFISASNIKVAPLPLYLVSLPDGFSSGGFFVSGGARGAGSRGSVTYRTVLFCAKQTWNNLVH